MNEKYSITFLQILPMQLRGPDPNAKNAYGDLVVFSVGKNLLGSNTSG